MSNKEKHKMSTSCSRIKSYLSLCRPPPQLASKPDSQLLHKQQQSPLLLPNTIKPKCPSIQVSAEKVRHLELELNRLKKCLSTATKNHKTQELIKIADGSYIHPLKNIGGPWKKLVMQISPPTIVENGSTALQVIRAMASMEMEELYNCLVESMPMSDLSGSDLSKIKKRGVVQGSEDSFMESVVLRSIDEIGRLVMEGLRIQMSSTRRGATMTETKVVDERCVVLVMLVQVRDPEEQYTSVGELMVALVQVLAAAAEIDERRCRSRGVHVAGIKCAPAKNSEEYYMWSASIQGCECVRNQDIAITL